MRAAVGTHMRSSRRAVHALFPFLVAAITACSAAPVAAAPRHDDPVPASEPRETLKLKIDLPKSASCEEAFDLALYEDRGIDIVEWGGPPTKCAGRTVVIRYLSKRTSRAQVLERVRKLAVSAAEGT
jgi:hypothetical protein